jgi:hypothetical protein
MSMFMIRTYTDEGNRTILGMYTENHIRTSKVWMLSASLIHRSDITKANKHVHKSVIIRKKYDALSNI